MLRATRLYLQTVKLFAHNGLICPGFIGNYGPFNLECSLVYGVLVSGLELELCEGGFLSMLSISAATNSDVEINHSLHLFVVEPDEIAKKSRVDQSSPPSVLSWHSGSA